MGGGGGGTITGGWRGSGNYNRWGEGEGELYEIGNCTYATLSPQD